jgi:hypothetical protein
MFGTLDLGMEGGLGSEASRLRHLMYVWYTRLWYGMRHFGYVCYPRLENGMRPGIRGFSHEALCVCLLH